TGWPVSTIRKGARSAAVTKEGSGGRKPVWDGAWAYTSPLFRSAINADDRSDLPGIDPGPQRVLGRPGLRADPAAGPRGRRRHLPPGHLPACAGPGAVERRLRAALAPPHRRPLRRKPEPAAALLPVPGGDEAQPG